MSPYRLCTEFVHICLGPPWVYHCIYKFLFFNYFNYFHAFNLQPILYMARMCALLMYAGVCICNYIIDCCYVTGNTSWLCNKARFSLQSVCPSPTYKTSCRLLGVTMSIIKVLLSIYQSLLISCKNLCTHG